MSVSTASSRSPRGLQRQNIASGFPSVQALFCGGLNPAAGGQQTLRAVTVCGSFRLRRFWCHDIAMLLPDHEFSKPASLAEALAVLQARPGDVKLLAGGTNKLLRGDVKLEAGDVKTEWATTKKLNALTHL